MCVRVSVSPIYRHGMGSSLTPEVLAYYLRGEEDARITQGRGRLELLRTQAVLSRVLPAPAAEVLDVGGASGVYAAWLRERGYDVQLIDPVPLHVEQARRHGVPATTGDARRIDAPDGSYDAVLLLGPLYHLPERSGRIQAWREAARVACPGGVVVAAAISRFAPIQDGLMKDFFADARFAYIAERDLIEGRHRNDDADPRWFTRAYFHRPEELETEVAETDLRLDELIAVEGVGHWLGDLDDILDDPRRRADLLHWLARLETEPSLLGASGHLLAVARRPGEAA